MMGAALNHEDEAFDAMPARICPDMHRRELLLRGGFY
jgi:hypothetical protein